MRLEGLLALSLIFSRNIVNSLLCETLAKDEANRTPTVVFGSDDEILTPLYENKHFLEAELQSQNKFICEESVRIFENEDLENLIPLLIDCAGEEDMVESIQNFENLQKIFRKQKTQLLCAENLQSDIEVNRIDVIDGSSTESMNIECELWNICSEPDSSRSCISPGTLIAATKVEKQMDYENGNNLKSELMELVPGTVIAVVPDIRNVEQNSEIILPDPSPTEESPANEVNSEFEDKNDLDEKEERNSLNDELINDMSHGQTYTGLRISLETEITTQYILKEMVPYFKKGKFLDVKSAHAILYRAYKILLAEEPLIDINIDESQKLIIFGDIHGQFYDFIKVIQEQGPPSNNLKYIFNGDIVDRGKNSVECLITLLAFKIAEPKNFYVGLGNHETRTVGKLQFYKETMKKYMSEEFFKFSHVVFKSFPIAFLVQNEIFVTHGGISPNLTLDRIRLINRLNPTDEDEDIINDLTWSDPVQDFGVKLSYRGLGYLYGPDVTKNFIFDNNISLIVRSHQFKEYGFSEEHDGLCVTLFSCPNYRGKMKNYGAFIKIDNNLNLSYHVFKAARSKIAYAPIPSSIVLARNVKRQK